MFIDRAKIYLVAGFGGDGAVSFLREKCREFGGPNGGNGGRGGSIFFVAQRGINTLSQYRHAIKVKAENGDKGHKKNSFGHAGKDVYLTVPVGTVILNLNGDILADLSKEGDMYLACKGGRGGRGNACFASSTNRSPKTAENGTPGETKTLILELKLLADVGLVGLPSVGKSTLLSVVSNAKPRTAEYDFTTLEPMLGSVRLSDTESFVIADLPGLIEGASKGKGLGFVFLRHIERCRVIIHIVDISREDDAFESFEKINKELAAYKLDLLKRPMIIAINKVDCLSNRDKIENFKTKINDKYGDRYPMFEISAISKQGCKPLLRKAYELVQTTPKFVLYTPEKTAEAVYDAKLMSKPKFKIMKLSPNHYRIEGEKVIKAYRLINHKTDEGMMKLLSYLNSIGVDDELRKIGARDGSSVIIDDFEFEYYN